MRRYGLAATCFVIGASLAPIAAYSADPDKDRSNTGAYVKDSVITAKVKTKLATEHLGSVANIRVDTDKDGVVYLSGTVRSMDEANRAIQVARDTGDLVRIRGVQVAGPHSIGR